jgi:coproporphyrinogen III oxidase-like Fe-S oxidoreductase
MKCRTGHCAATKKSSHTCQRVPAGTICCTGATTNIWASDQARTATCAVALRRARSSGRRWGNRKPVAGYTRRIRQGEEVTEFEEVIGDRLAMGETMMLGLRLIDEGVAFDRFQTLHAADLRTLFGGELVDLQRSALLQLDDARVRLTPKGLMVGNQVFARFLPDET